MRLREPTRSFACTSLVEGELDMDGAQVLLASRNPPERKAMRAAYSDIASTIVATASNLSSPDSTKSSSAVSTANSASSAVTEA